MLGGRRITDHERLEAVFESPIAQVARHSDGIDCLVIGSGTAGVTTALSLADHGLRVLILEAGPLTLVSHIGKVKLADHTGLASKLTDSATIATHWVILQEDQTATRAALVPAWLLVGGRTMFWTGTAPRYQPWDFDDWPISADDMAHFYDRAESLMKGAQSAIRARVDTHRCRAPATPRQSIVRSRPAAHPSHRRAAGAPPALLLPALRASRRCAIGRGPTQGHHPIVLQWVKHPRFRASPLLPSTARKWI